MAKQPTSAFDVPLPPEMAANARHLLIFYLVNHDKATFVELAKHLREQRDVGKIQLSNVQIKALIEQLVLCGDIAREDGEYFHPGRLTPAKDVICRCIESRRLVTFDSLSDFYYLESWHVEKIITFGVKLESLLDELLASGTIVRDGMYYTTPEWLASRPAASPSDLSMKEYSGVMLDEPEAIALEDLGKLINKDIYSINELDIIKTGSANMLNLVAFEAVDGHVIKLWITRLKADWDEGWVEDFNKYTLLAGLPESIGNLVHLQKLYLSENHIAALPESFGNLASLEVLDLSGNKLASLPESMGCLSRLVTLELFDNKLATLPDSFGDLPHLVDLNLCENVFESFPESLTKITSLQVLRIFDNKIRTIPPSIGNLHNLKVFYINNNPITSLPEEIGNLASLECLGARDCKLVSIPASMQKMVSLQVINISGNPVHAKIPPSLSDLGWIKTHDPAIVQ